MPENLIKLIFIILSGISVTYFIEYENNPLVFFNFLKFGTTISNCLRGNCKPWMVSVLSK